MSRIFIHQPDEWACGYYRAMAPMHNCYQACSDEGIQLVSRHDLRSDELFYDSYMFHRMPQDSLIKFAQYIKQESTANITWAIDDDLFNVPDYMPTRSQFQDKEKLNMIVELADLIVVSTENLKDMVQRPEKTIVAPNLVEPNLYNASNFTSLSDEPIRVLWAGSCFHDEDLSQLIRPIKKLMKEFKDNVTFVWFGYIPTEFAEFMRLPGEASARVVCKDHGMRMAYIDGVEFRYYHDKLLSLQPHITLAPLVENTFNVSKSSVKFYEYSMAGGATIATDMVPYECIQHEKTGLLVDPGDEDGWVHAIRRLVKDKKLRHTLAANAKDWVLKNVCWNDTNREAWMNVFRKMTAHTHEAAKCHKNSQLVGV